MKVYIMTDMEGLSGVGHADYIREDGPYHADARRYLMGDLNAAIAGAFDAGAAEVYARDGHYKGNNFIMDMLDPRATHEIGVGGWYSRLDASFDAAFVVGAHAMAGTRDAFLDHTQCPQSIFAFRVNGRPMGELGQWALGCGEFGVPMAMVAGDEAACVEARAFFPGVRTVAVKRAVGRNRALCYPVAETQQRIREAAAAALKNLKRLRPFKVRKPIRCEQVYTRCDYADAAAAGQGYERVDGRTCRKTARRQTDIIML